MRLKDRVAIVTGSSRGIGLAIARGYAREGAHVVLTSRNESSLVCPTEELQKLGVRVLPLRMDVTIPGDVQEMVNRVEGEFGRPGAYSEPLLGVGSQGDEGQRPGDRLDPDRSREGVVARGALDPEKLMARTPMGRIGTPEDLVGPSIFLASDDSAFVTGQVLAVDGGWLSYAFMQAGTERGAYPASIPALWSGADFGAPSSVERHSLLELFY